MVVSRRMPKHITFCIDDFPPAIEYDESTGRANGYFGETATYIIEVIKKVLNYTIVVSNGEKLINNETGEYGGCYGKLQRS